MEGEEACLVEVIFVLFALPPATGHAVQLVADAAEEAAVTARLLLARSRRISVLAVGVLLTVAAGKVLDEVHVCR